jgi:hypothetical protein
LAFGDYCEVYDGTDNTWARCIPFIALYPCNNVAGSWAFLNLVSWQRILRSQWTRMVTMEEIMEKMNSINGMEENAIADISIAPIGVRGDVERIEEEPSNPANEEAEEPIDDEGCPESEDQGDKNSDDAADEQSGEEPEEVVQDLQSSARVRAGV